MLAPLAVVFALVAIDYVVWNWAIGANHEILALIAGLAMAPLAIALAWLAALALGSGALVLARRFAQQLASRLGARPAGSTRPAHVPRRARRARSRRGDADSRRDRIAA
jgi:hypothetical protein